MKFRKFGKTLLTAALSTAIVFSLSSCVRSFTAGYLYVTGTVTATPTGNGIISGFKIDNNTGKLKPIDGFPLGSAGANPTRIVLLSGGQFVYVLNRGLTAGGSTDCTTADPCLNPNIAEFTVGNNGILTFQQYFYTQGINPMRLISDTSGNYLLALDHDAPSNTYCGVVIQNATSCGDVTVFQVNTSTGRLSLVANAALTSQFNTQVTYFPVPANPIDFALAGSFLETLSGLPGASVTEPPAAAQTYYPYSYNTSTGQLAQALFTPGTIANGSSEPMGQGTAIVYAGGKLYVLDNEPLTVTSDGTTTTSPSQILPFTVGSNGTLNSLVGGATPNDPTESAPIYLIVESKGKFLYVANQLGASASTAAGIAGFVIDPAHGQLSANPGSPYPVGTGATPVCLLEDPSNQYIYTANQGDSSVTGHLLDPNSGTLNQLRGSTGVFALNGPATWCVATGRTN